MQVAKGQGITVFVIGHVNKEGSIAGPKVLEHMVDCVLYFEATSTPAIGFCGRRRTASALPTRSVFLKCGTRAGGGGEPVGNAALRPTGGAPGTCVTCVMEGVRPVLAELQALVVSSAGGNPRRTSNGFDYNRAAMLLAVLEKRGGLKVSACDAI